MEEKGKNKRRKIQEILDSLKNFDFFFTSALVMSRGMAILLWKKLRREQKHINVNMRAVITIVSQTFAIPLCRARKSKFTFKTKHPNS